MPDLASLILTRRKEMGLSRARLAEMCGISHTEIARIESGERKLPSLKIMYTLADQLALGREQVLAAAGYDTDESTSPLQRAFPALKTPKQLETAQYMVESLAKNADLMDEDLDDLRRQIDMFISYAHQKQRS